MAIAGIVAAPVASAEVYISARLGVESVSSDAAAEEGLQFGNLASRLGWRGETDLGNGMTAFGSLEAAADGFGLRELHVGLSGDFGSVKVGEDTYAAFYNHVQGPVDPTYWTGGGGLVKAGRTERVINYEGGTDMFRFGIGIEADGDTDPGPDGDGTIDDGVVGTQLAVSFDVADWTIALGSRDGEDADDNTTAGSLTGFTVYGNVGDISVAVSMQEDDAQEGLQLHVGFGSAWINYGSKEDVASGAEPTVIAVGYSAPLGRQTQWWVEAESVDADGGTDESSIVAAIRYDYN